ncbi:RNA 3'-terminal phosphate cyclase [Chitiniphilus shinanonensis]|uniref:RNA 3'-terminal phosphate cyclase n=1 Tax=Chitiniphilus shinanonensis TaxID=553088 RepID=A0ABQ6BV64_9NEIS|nr:RNA 3'-terminal phosphate cyclase [Chitiniphilus shinanonensis]GLS05075.1 RNA 3'-terminal phosphate cyclase [Chitiniphilus shinanonensis]
MKTTQQQDWLALDGAEGEGGGQVLRSALTLSAISGRPFRIERIRAGRAKPGLLRQHLTAVQAAAAICGATVQGAELGSTRLSFVPGMIRGGDYRFAIGSAGSCTLVLQTVLPALWFADAPSTVTVSGGTHNQAAPPADFLIRAWWPLVATLGVQQQLVLLRHGFYPAGGGEVRASVTPCAALQPLDLTERGALRQVRAEALVARVPAHVAQRELARVTQHLGEVAGEARVLPPDEGPGNVLLIEVVHEQVSEVFTAFGERGVSAEAVADRAAREARQYLAGRAAVGEHLADQLLLPLALAGGGRFTATCASSHLRTNAMVIERFLPVRVEVADEDGAARVTVHPRVD